MSLAAKKDVYGTFSNDSEWVKVVYDFSIDAGATGDYDIIEAKENLICLDFYAEVQTAVTSTGTVVQDIGIGDGGTEFKSNWALVNGGVAQTSSATVAFMDTAIPVSIASGSKVVMSIDDAVITAGKIAYNFLLKKK